MLTFCLRDTSQRPGSARGYGYRQCAYEEPYEIHKATGFADYSSAANIRVLGPMIGGKDRHLHGNGHASLPCDLNRRKKVVVQRVKNDGLKPTVKVQFLV